MIFDTIYWELHGYYQRTTICLLMLSVSLFSCVGTQPQDSSSFDITDSPSPTWTGTIITEHAIEIELEDMWATDTARAFRPSPTPVRTPTFSPKKQAVLATALAYMGDDKADNLRLESIYANGPGNGHSVRFRQLYEGIYVNNTIIEVTVKPEDVFLSYGEYYEDITLPSITPTIFFSQALDIATDAVGVQGNYSIIREFTRLEVFRVPTEGKKRKFILAWDIDFNASCPFGSWTVTINAYTGDVLSLSAFMAVEPEFQKAACPTPALVPYPTPIPAP